MFLLFLYPRAEIGKGPLKLVIVLLTAFWWFSCSFAVNYLDPGGPKYSGNFAAAAPAFNDTLAVVSFNIKFSEQIDQAIRELSEIKELQNADIILLQEMDNPGCEAIARALEYNYLYYPASIHPKHGKDFGNAILSKWPLRQGRKIILPYKNDKTKQRRIAISAMAMIGDRQILTYCVHSEGFWVSRAKRIAQIDSVIHSIPATARCVIVGGDFNTIGAGSNREAVKSFTEAGLEHATAGVGSTTRLGFIKVTVDHIFTRGMQILEAGKVETARASDHFPVWVKLKME